jgi:hypothetical protein
MRANQAVRFVVTVTIAAVAQLAAGREAAGAQFLQGVATVHTLIASKPRVHTTPYSKLFAVPDLKVTTSTPPRLESVGDVDKPTVVCGMKLIPADPSIDRGIATPPRRGDTRYSIRAVPPPLCK